MLEVSKSTHTRENLKDIFSAYERTGYTEETRGVFLLNLTIHAAASSVLRRREFRNRRAAPFSNVRTHAPTKRAGRHAYDART